MGHLLGDTWGLDSLEWDCLKRMSLMALSHLCPQEGELYWIPAGHAVAMRVLGGKAALLKFWHETHVCNPSSHFHRTRLLITLADRSVVSGTSDDQAYILCTATCHKIVVLPAWVRKTHASGALSLTLRGAPEPRPADKSEMLTTRL